MLACAESVEWPSYISFLIFESFSYESIPADADLNRRTESNLRVIRPYSFSQSLVAGRGNRLK